jgi:hypothetical protein
MGLVVAQVQPADAFTLFSSLLDNYQPGQATDPKANADGQTLGQFIPMVDFSDCANQIADHWSWPVGTDGNVTIVYAYDPSFDQLFAGLDPSIEANVKLQIQQAMNQWTTAYYGSQGYYGLYDSYARSSGLTVLQNQSLQNTTPAFMDVRSAVVHELGHVLGFAHCDQGVTVGRNYAYFDGSNLRGSGGQNIQLYSGDFDPMANFYNAQTGFNNNGNPLSVGYSGQEVMSEYSSSGNGLGRSAGEINHTLSWDELDGYRFIYGAAPLVFTNIGSPTLIIKAAPLSDPRIVCEGVPSGLPNSPNTPFQGVTIEGATITFNTAFAPWVYNPLLQGEQIGYGTVGYNLDITTFPGLPKIYGTSVTAMGTDNTNLTTPTFDNFDIGQPDNDNPDYVFNQVATTYDGVPPLGQDTKDSITVKWSAPNAGIPPSNPALNINHTLHVGLTPDVFDWIDFPLSASVYDANNTSYSVPVAPVHFWIGTGFTGYANNSTANNPFRSTCLTATTGSNFTGVAGLAVTAPADGTKLFNLQVADATDMGLALSNLNMQLLNRLQQSNQVITVTNFGTNVLNRGQTFVVILQGDASYLPSNIISNHNYMYFNRPDLLGKQLFAYVGSTNNHMRVDNFTLLNAPAAKAAGGRPTLNIQPDLTNTVTLSWPSAFAGYTLQQSTSLGGDGGGDGGDGWFKCSNGLPHPPHNGTNSVTVPITSPTMFYRLSIP